ncbi:MAG: 4a-hydroxytetrahydrobiopterin dehydratase [Dehalococcoidia bacterium]|nr:4a-hydroxytetrahydrobiopterin dehydratase [Dehalococcoidia bacterium]|tara:strand:+ start:864 stop:1148 length:285 start_codon:yes stop_codon:yes gene_type:complete
MPQRLSSDEIGEVLARLSGWAVDGDDGIRKTFKFEDHITAMGFVNRVAMAAEVMNHHPELSIVYSTVEIRLSTHDAGGVTQLDIQLAERIEHYA